MNPHIKISGEQACSRRAGFFLVTLRRDCVSYFQNLMPCKIHKFHDILSKNQQIASNFMKMLATLIKPNDSVIDFTDFAITTAKNGAKYKFCCRNIKKT